MSARRSESTVAEPLEDRFGSDVPVRIAALVASDHPGLSSEAFVDDALVGCDERALTPRARQVPHALAARDPDVHVRRLVSEGTRPRLPWAPRRRALRRGPGPAVDLLERLEDDPEPYLRRSVAVDRLTVEAASVAIGARLHVDVEPQDPTADRRSVLLDLRAHVVKPIGSRRPKGFKGATLDLEPGDLATSAGPTGT